MQVATQAVFIMPAGQFKSLRSLNCPICLDHLHSKRTTTEESQRLLYWWPCQEANFTAPCWLNGSHVTNVALMDETDSMLKTAANCSAALFNHSTPRQDKMGGVISMTLSCIGMRSKTNSWTLQRYNMILHSGVSFLFPIELAVYGLCLRGSGREIDV